jgi:hypothetical protein
MEIKQTSARTYRLRKRRREREAGSKISNPSPNVPALAKARASRTPRGRISSAERILVITLTVAMAGWKPSSVTWLGETVQVDPVGAPLQLSVTVLLNPPSGDMVNE